MGDTPEAVLFDMDGVLLHSHHAWFHVVNQCRVDQGYEPISLERFDDTWGQSLEDDVRDFFPELSPDGFGQYCVDNFMAHQAHISVDPRAGPTLDGLRELGVPTAVVTNSPTDLARQMLAHGELQASAVVGATDVPAGKPAPDMVLLACERLSVATTRAVMVGDSRFDRQAAAAAGVPFVGFRTEGRWRIEELDEVLTLLAKG